MAVSHADDGTTVRTQVAGIGRYWWVVLVVLALAVGLAVYATRQTVTTYTGRSSLIVNSPNRAPDQDAILVQGYVDYFNNKAYQSQLASQADVTDPVTLQAQAAAASPILLVQATARTPDLAKSAASGVAEAFRADVNKQIDLRQETQVQGLQTQLDSLQGRPNADPNVVANLESQLATIKNDQTNRLQPLQLDGGVSVNQPNLVQNVGLGAVGGLAIGLLIAFLLASLRRTRRTRR